MKKNVLITLLLTIVSTIVYGQDLISVQKAIDAEQFDKAKNILQSLTLNSEIDGESYFQLGRLYVTLNEIDSAQIYFKKGLPIKKNGKLNYVGLGFIDLNNGNKQSAKESFEKALQGIRKKDTKELIYIAEAYIYADNPDYEKAVDYLNRVLKINPKLAQAYILLGNAHYKLTNVSEAYSAYRNALDYDNNLLQPRLQMAVITKWSKAFPDAIKALNEIAEIDSEFGPVYRELAETYYLWANEDPSKYKEYIAKALDYYKKYMSLTDYSLDSRMRHADFLILAKDYAALEKETQEMQKIDKVNIRILRYHGYSAYENKHYMEAVKALDEFITKVPRRAITSDYIYLTKARFALAVDTVGTVLNQPEFDNALASLNKVVEKQPALIEEFAPLAVKIYKTKDYINAAKLLEVVLKNPKSSLVDQFYYANSIFYYVAQKEEEERSLYVDLINKADTAYATIIERAPTTQDAYFNRARLNRFIETEEAEKKVAEIFEAYIKTILEKGNGELEKQNVKRNLSEAYTSIGAYYSNIEKDKAIENFEKALEIDPENEHAQQSLNFLKK